MNFKKDGVGVPGANLTKKKSVLFSPVTTKSAQDDNNQPGNATCAKTGTTERKATVLENHGYSLGKTIGTGSYATVKVANSERHKSHVAVKIVSKFQAPSDYLKKFLPREIEVVKGLKHQHLIRFLQAIETTHRVYIIMEYAEKGSLLDIIRRDSYIDEPRGKCWFKQLVDAVEYCHDKGVVHRDIKCENLLMDKDYNIKLSDFGFARGCMKPKNGVPIMSETFCGSYAYASPEILRGIPYQPQMSDIWSMGVVLYATVYGRLPFDDSNYSQLLKQVQSKVTFPKEPKISALCRSLILHILAPVKQRIRIAGIRNDPWLTQSDNDIPQGYKTEELDTEDERPSSLLTMTSSEENVTTTGPDTYRGSSDYTETDVEMVRLPKSQNRCHQNNYTWTYQPKEDLAHSLPDYNYELASLTSSHSLTNGMKSSKFNEFKKLAKKYFCITPSSVPSDKSAGSKSIQVDKKENSTSKKPQSQPC